MKIIPEGHRRCLIVLIALFLIFFSILDNKNQTLPTPEIGKPITLTQPIDINTCHIAQILDDGERMYILADDHLGYVQVYGLNGEYQQTMLFFCHPNGAFNIAVDGKTFYVRDKYHNIYIFENGNFDTYVPVRDNTYALEELDFTSFSTRYELRWASVWRTDKKTPFCVIERPFWTGFIQYNGAIILGGMFMLLVYSFVRFLKTRKNHHG